MGLIFDTSISISAERRQRSVADIVAQFNPLEQMGISVVTVAELQHGIRRSIQPHQRRQRELFLGEVLSLLAVYPVMTAIALRVGDLDAELAMSGARTRSWRLGGHA
jgi:predicted nucleic acid-binding protein